jgi:hypothetical protein
MCQAQDGEEIVIKHSTAFWRENEKKKQNNVSSAGFCGSHL